MENNRKALRADVSVPLSSSRNPDCSSSTSARLPHEKRGLASEKFSNETIRQLKSYVYRLVDSRNGRTFYVGKGTGNRVFDHARGALLAEDEDAFDLKTKLIREIRNAKLSVIPIIHRHGLDEKVALEIEAALIDAYPGLANAQSGHGSSERGCRNAAEVQTLYGAKEADFKKLKAIIIKIRQTTVDEKGSVYEAVRASWRINPDNAKGLPVIACVGGIIQGVFTDVEWHDSADNPGRYEFTAKESHKKEHKLLVGHRLPSKFCKRGMAAPVLYT